MNLAHLHLVLTHLPIVGLFMVMLINLYAIFNKNNEIKKLTLWGYVVVGIFVVLAYFTGDGAEEIVKTYPNISNETIELHEHFALAFLIGLSIISSASVYIIYKNKEKQISDKTIQFLLIGSFILCVIAIETGSTGGNIRHSEITQGEFINK